MTVNTEVKGTLARLLATENLTVEHRRVSTACFDVDKRLLILPIWKTASNTVYDLLVGHEVGHALYTPAEDYTGAKKDFVNVLEDVRIEKMMKVTYPGLRRTFYDGYGELWQQDFFGVGGTDMDEMAFIDRINLYYKGCNDLEFTDEEKPFVDRAAKTKTFQDVIELAKDLYTYCETKQTEKEAEQLANAEQQQELFPGEQEEVELDGESDDQEFPGDPQGQKEESDDLTDDLDYGSEPVGGKLWDGTDVDETESVPDVAFKQALETLVDDSAKEWVYLDLPKIQLDKIVIPAAKIKEELYYHFKGQAFSSPEAQEWYNDNIEYGVDHYNKFKKSSGKTVTYLVKQFEMKKSADQYKRAAVSKTGVINTNSLHKYKLTEDIFKKITTVADGKNHGLVMFLDWSGSMQNCLLDTLKQTYNLVWFCKKANIPFRVYGFQSGCGYHRHESFHPAVKQKLNSLNIEGDVNLLEFLTSKQNNRSLEESMQLLYLQAFAMAGHRLPHCQNITLGGTPLAEAIFCARDIVRELKATERVTKVNVVCLTDGEANPITYIGENNYTYHDEEFRSHHLCHSHGKVFFLRDPETGYTRKLDHSPYRTTEQIVSFYREITDYNWVGIRLCSKSEVNRVFRNYAWDEYTILDKQWRKEKFASIKNKAGFSESFYMPNQGLGEDTQDIEVKSKGETATKGELTRAFKKHMSSKMTNKTILNRFIEQIA